MATHSDLASRLRSAWPALLAAVCLGGGLVAPCNVRGESITASDFRIDLASNPAWINNSQPAVGLKLWRQTAMEQAVLASRPYVVVTNNSTGGAIQSFQLNLSNRPATAVTGCVWDAAQQASTWSWSPSLRTAVFNFATPIQSGQSFTLRLATGPRSPDPNAYTLQQNFFAPGQAIFGEQTSSAAPGYGVLGLTVTNPPPVPAGAMVAATSTTTTGSVSQFTYPLDSVVIDSFSTYGQQVGITIAPVPEPSGIVLLAAAGCVGVATLRIRRRASRTQPKTPSPS